MKKGIHPTSRDVIFLDITSNSMFLVPSTIETTETGEFEGKEYPLFRVETSSASHPFYTGQEKSVESAGRVEKFRARQKKVSSQ